LQYTVVYNRYATSLSATSGPNLKAVGIRAVEQLIFYKRVNCVVNYFDRTLNMFLEHVLGLLITAGHAAENA